MSRSRQEKNDIETAISPRAKDALSPSYWCLFLSNDIGITKTKEDEFNNMEI